MSHLPGVPLGTRVGPAIRRRPGPDGSPPGRDHCGAAPAAATVIRDWWPAGWPIPQFLDGVELPSRPPVLLHTEIMRQHLLTAEGPEGHGGCPGRSASSPPYAGARVRVRRRRAFAAESDSRLLARTLTACDYRDQLDADLRRQLLAWGIMHRYSNLTWWMRLPERPRAVAIYGPTSSGKTTLSLDVCEAASEHGLHPVILNADSRQVYAGMDIGTSKIKPWEMRGFEHRLLDVAQPTSKLSLEAYAQMARDELASLPASDDALPVLVGGTGVYVQSVLDGWDLTGTGTLRRSLERDFPRSDVKVAHQVLARLAPEVARRVHPNNYEVILNALVRRMAGGAGNEVSTPFAFAVYGVDRGEAETDRRIETTLDAQIRGGLLAEIAELDRRYRLVEQARRPGRRRNVAWETHGYREFVRMAASTGKAIEELDGADLAAARAEALGHIWAYSRRQRSWFRKLGASRVDYRSAVKNVVSRLQ
jgi:tRNA dimethylallyltransferase